jgi:hypothetical protein
MAGVAQVSRRERHSELVVIEPDHDEIVVKFRVCELEDNAAFDAGLDIDDPVAGSELGH